MLCAINTDAFVMFGMISVRMDLSSAPFSNAMAVDIPWILVASFGMVKPSGLIMYSANATSFFGFLAESGG